MASSVEALSRHLMWSGGGLRISDDRWVSGRHPSARSGREPSWVLVFVRTGSYAVRLGKGLVVGDSNSAILYRPEETFAATHGQSFETTATTLELDPESATPALEQLPSARHRHLVPAKCFLFHRSLIEALRHGPTEELAIEDGVAWLIAQVLDLPPSSDRAAEGATIRAVLQRLSSEFDRPLTLAVLSRDLGCSPWHLSRSFRARVGMPLHRYLTRLRLRNAVERLAQGCRDLTALALQVGFSSHSHFSASFRREFGLAPSAVRASMGSHLCHLARHCARPPVID